MSAAQAEKAARFRALHRPGAPFVTPNPWDVAGARLMAGLGFPALATTSAGLAFSQGLRDGTGAIDRAAAIAHVAAMAAATALPLSADLENGYADAPEGVAETVAAAAEAGAVGVSIEDVRPDRAEPVYPFDAAVARIEAAAAAAQAQPVPPMLTARADGLLTRAYDLDEAIRRLQAFEAAGAAVLYAPGLPDKAAIKAVCAAVSAPVNHVIGLGAPGLSRLDLASAGVARISLGGSLSRVALSAMLKAGEEIRAGRFDLAEADPGWGPIMRAMRAGAPGGLDG